MKTSKSWIATAFSKPCNDGFLMFFSILALFLFTLTGCGNNGSGVVSIPQEEPITLNLRGKVNLNNIKFPTNLCGNNDYQFRDLSVFNLSIQDDYKNTAYVSSNGEFSFPEMESRQQVVIFCKNSSNSNLVFEWMGASSSGLSGQIEANININSTARSYIARALRERYGKRVRPEAIEDEYIITTVDAITDVVEKNSDLLNDTLLSEVPSVKNAYTAIADSLSNGTGAYPNNHVFLFYFAGDNDLGIDMENSIRKITEAGLPNNTQIIICLDTFHSLPTLNKPGAARYRLVENSLELLDDFGDIDSTDSSYLVKFIEVSVREFPAKGYSLILSSHGGGWRERERFISNARTVFMNDTTSLATGTVLNTASGIETAFSNLNANNRKFDMIVLDSCNMGCVEVAYEIGNFADYTVFSQALMPSTGMPYDEFFKQVNTKGIENLSAYDKAELLCDLYCNKYLNSSFDTGISIIDNSNIGYFVNSCNSYFEAIYNKYDEYAPLVYNVRTLKTTNDGENVSGDVIQNFSTLNEFVDFKQLNDKCRNILNEAKIQSDDLATGFVLLVKYSKYSSNLKNANGISITFPNKEVYNSYYDGILPADEYFHLKFNKLTKWDELLKIMCFL